MSKYDPLREYLRRRQVGIWTASFKEVEKVLGRPLPTSARKHRAWWGNEDEGAHVHAHAWRDAGWHVDHAELDMEMVRFRRDEPFRPPAGMPMPAG